MIENERGGGNLDRLRYELNELTLYKAGLPRFNRNFARDGIVSAILFADSDMLRDQLMYCAQHQGRKKDPDTGEEFGKIFHEIGSPKVRGLYPEYNACDTTGLFLLGHEMYMKMADDKSLFEDQSMNINAAVEYIRSHLKNNTFRESPHFSGGTKFALKTTYWKDSGVPNRPNGEPKYPVVYPLAHAQNMRGMQSAAKILRSSELTTIGNEMLEVLIEEMYGDGLFYLAKDLDGVIEGCSSDSLHIMLYTYSLPRKLVKGIEEASEVLETPIGYRTLCPSSSDKSLRDYHAKTVRPFEQACIYLGAKKFAAPHAQVVSSRVFDFLKSDPEMIMVHKNDRLEEAGCKPCLRTIAAKHWFKHKKNKFYNEI